MEFLLFSLKGDSGGPLQRRIVDDFHEMYHILGVTSFGFGCATSKPAIYTRVSAYLDWIEANVWPEQ